MIPIEKRWAVLDILIKTNNPDEFGVCYKFLTGQYTSKKTLNNRILTLFYCVSDVSVLKRRKIIK